MIKIKYTKKRLRHNLKTGLAFITMAIVLLIISYFTDGIANFSLESIGMGFIGMGFFWLALYYFDCKKQYLTLREEEIIKHDLFPRKIQFKQIKSIRYFAGQYKLISNKGEFTIDTDVIEPHLLEILKKKLNSLNLWEFNSS